MTRKTSWTTVRTITTNAPNPSAVPNGTAIVAERRDVDEVADAGRERAGAGAAGDRDRRQRQQAEGVLGEHPAAADRQRVGLVLELAGRADGAEQGMPAGDRAAGDRDEQHRPQRLDAAPPVPS